MNRAVTHSLTLSLSVTPRRLPHVHLLDRLRAPNTLSAVELAALVSDRQPCPVLVHLAPATALPLEKVKGRRRDVSALQQVGDPLLLDASGEKIAPGGTQRIDRRYGQKVIQKFKGRIDDGLLVSEAKDGMRSKKTEEKHLPANPARYVYTCMRQCLT